MIVACIGALVAFSGQSKLPSSVSLRGQYERAGLTVCSQNGPLCWDYTLIGLLEYVKARGPYFAFPPGFSLGQRLRPTMKAAPDRILVERIADWNDMEFPDWKTAETPIPTESGKPLAKPP